LSKKLTEAHIEEAASSLKGSKVLRDMHRSDEQACEKIMVALERLVRFGFDMEAFTTAKTDLGDVLKSETRKSLQQLRDQCQSSTTAVCRDRSGQLTSPGQRRPCEGSGQHTSDDWTVPTKPNDQVTLFSSVAQPVSTLGDAGRATCVRQTPGSTAPYLQPNDGLDAGGAGLWDPNALSSTTDELGDFELLSWNDAFQYLGTDQTISHPF
jgi:hypothetical protein